MSTILKEVDFKSFLIGILLTMVVVLFVGGKPAPEIMKVQIVGCDDGVKLPVSNWSEYYSPKPISVNIAGIESNLKIPVKLVIDDYYDKPLPVKISDINKELRIKTE